PTVSRAPRQRPSSPTRRSSDLAGGLVVADRDDRGSRAGAGQRGQALHREPGHLAADGQDGDVGIALAPGQDVVLVSRLDLIGGRDRKSTRLNSSHVKISYAVFC